LSSELRDDDDDDDDDDQSWELRTAAALRTAAERPLQPISSGGRKVLQLLIVFSGRTTMLHSPLSTRFA